jgi:hypothetical protein
LNSAKRRCVRCQTERAPTFLYRAVNLPMEKTMNDEARDNRNGPLRV